MKEILWQTILWITTVCCFLATLKLSLLGTKVAKTKNHIVASPFWLFVLIIFIPWMIGAFGRGESSAIPWEEFKKQSDAHGLADGILSMLIVLTVDLWLFWTPSHLYITSKMETDNKNSIFIRLLNITFGLLLTTSWNPLYKLLD